MLNRLLVDGLRVDESAARTALTPTVLDDCIALGLVQVEGDTVVVMVGGKEAGIVGFDKATGKTKWQTSSDPSSSGWRESGLGRVRRTLCSAPPCPLLLALRGVRAGALSPSAPLSRYPWSELRVADRP